MGFIEQVRHLCQRPGMYVGQPHFTSVCAYLRGFDSARDGGPLAGFREWLVVKMNGADNMIWEGLVRLLLVPDATSNTTLTAEEDATCLAGLLSLLEEFHAYRQEHGITKIHYMYARWLLRKSWYAGSLRSKPRGEP